MALRDNIRAEFERSPLTVIATLTGVVVATLALLVAWLQYSGQPVSAGSTNSSGPPAPAELQISNLLVVTAFFFAASFSVASLVRMLERYNRFAAVVLSVLAAVLVAFATMLILKFVPPRVMTSDLLQRAEDIVSWSTLFVFVAIAGASSARDFAESRPPRSPQSAPNGKAEPDGIGAIVGLLIMLGIWGFLVWTGLNKLTQLFLA
jgi:hypothetical protein